MCKKVTDDGKTRLTCNLFRRGASNGITMQTEEQELIRRIAGGETRLCARLVDRYGRAVYTLAARIAGCTEDAEELTQDIFLKAFSSLDRFGGRSSFSTWLYRIAYNTAVSHARRTRPKHCGIDERRLAALPDSEADRLEEWAEKQERLDALNRAVERLDPEERALVTLFYYEDRSVGECAAITGTLGRQRQGAAPPNPEKTICTGKRRDEWNRVMRYAAQSGKFRPRNCPQASPRG